MKYGFRFHVRDYRKYTVQFDRFTAGVFLFKEDRWGGHKGVFFIGDTLGL